MSYNRPKLSACATWDPNAVTLADNSTFGGTSTGLFITTNNTVFSTGFGLNSVLVWPEGSVNATQSIFTDLSRPYGVFVTTVGDVYADNGRNNYRVEKWAVNATSSTVTMNVGGPCTDIFADTYDSLYCSLFYDHRVLKRPAGSGASTSFMIAGNGINGSAPNMFDRPCGIFVHVDLSLYVADFGNSRIQLFESGQLNGSTVAGRGAPGTISLNGPTKPVLDGNGYLFIIDQLNSRIVGSGSYGFRCIVGCLGTSGSADNQLLWPYGLGFDSYGNLYVTDAFNNRLQKFTLARNSCGE